MTTWTRIEPYRTSRRRALTDCEVLTSESGRGRRIKVKLPAALVAALGWKKGDPTSVAWSQDGNATRLRLSPCILAKGFRLQHESKASTHFIVFNPMHPVDRRRSAQTVAHLAAGNALVLTVPAWAAIGDPPLPARKDAA